jgi:hypothetical protein
MLAVAASSGSDLLSAAAIRERSANITSAVEAGESKHFSVDRSRLQTAAQRCCAAWATCWKRGPTASA